MLSAVAAALSGGAPGASRPASRAAAAAAEPRRDAADPAGYDRALAQLKLAPPEATEQRVVRKAVPPEATKQRAADRAGSRSRSHSRSLCHSSLAPTALNRSAPVVPRKRRRGAVRAGDAR